MGTPKMIFFSYSDQNEDLELYNKIHKHFAAYSSIGLLTIIDKKELFKITGDKSKITELLKSSDITIPLLSIDFINDEACLEQLQSAAGEDKLIIPVLLRDFDWEAFKEITKYKNQMLPDDLTPVENRISSEGNDDTVFKEIAQRVKAFILPEIKNLQIQKTSHRFDYLLASLILIIGIVASVIVYHITEKFDSTQQLLFTALSLLMFACIGLIALKNVLFPNKVNIKKQHYGK